MSHRQSDFPGNRPFWTLDGGLATRLEQLGLDLTGSLWSARALLEAPELVQRVHEDYLSAGADAIATATYQATVEGFRGLGVTAARGRELFGVAVELARAAANAVAPEALVAGSLGPYGAALADGSEYRGDYGIGSGELADFHRPRMRLLSAASPDLLAFETVPSALEALVLQELLDESPGPPAWISFSCRDATHLADGTSFAELVPRLQHPRIVALGVNCVPPQIVEEALRTLRRLTGKPLLAYPNSGESYADGSWSGAASEASELAALAPAWVEAGAVAVGGCCRVGPEEIRQIKKALLR